MLELARENTIAKARCGTSPRSRFFLLTGRARPFRRGMPSANFLECAAVEDASVAKALWRHQAAERPLLHR